MWKDYLIALSFTNMAFVNLWTKFFYGEKFYNKSFPTANSFLALILNEILFSLLFFGGIQIVRRVNNRHLTRCVKIFICLMTLCFINVVILDLHDTLPNFNDTLVKDVVILVTIVLLIKKWMTKTVIRFLQIFLPFVLIIWGQCIFGIVSDAGRVKVSAPLNKQFFPASRSARVLWMIFDETDQRIAFEERPANIKLPEFDRLRKQAFYATNAYPPSDATMTSVPSLISGHLVKTAGFSGLTDLELTFRDGAKPISWGRDANVLYQARQLKRNTALIGEFLPYDRLLGRNLNYCFWSAYKYDWVPASDTLLANINAQLLGFLHTVNLHYWHHQNSYHDTMGAAKQIVADPKYGLIFIHFPIPHGPFFAGQPWWVNSEKGYAGNLMLADRSVGELRRWMEAKGIWDQTTVILSSDHWFRTTGFDGKMERRVPFLMKCAGQKENLTYDTSFNTVMTADLVTAILRGDIATSDAVRAWINKHRSKETFIPPF